MSDAEWAELLKRLVIGHTDECLQYAAQTGKAFCIASCADLRQQTVARVVALEELLKAVIGAETIEASIEYYRYASRTNVALFWGEYYNRIADALEAVKKANDTTNA